MHADGHVHGYLHAGRVVVTDERKVVGILSAFDLLKLVEDHRFQMKQAPTPGKHKRNTRT